MFPQKPLRLIKLDIEGGEKALFETAASGLTSVDFVFAELHDRILPGCTAAFAAFSQDRFVFNFGGEKFLSAARGAANG